jgi:hypothetical protein
MIEEKAVMHKKKDLCASSGYLRRTACFSVCSTHIFFPDIIFGIFHRSYIVESLLTFPNQGLRRHRVVRDVCIEWFVMCFDMRNPQCTKAQYRAL